MAGPGFHGLISAPRIDPLRAGREHHGMPHIRVNGADLHYEDTGRTGQPERTTETLVFSHGLLWSGRMYDPQVAYFKDRYRCITFDFRGQGQSEVTAAGYDMDTLTDDAAALLSSLAAAPCHFVGLSMGGFVGLRLALRRPDLLSSLSLLESAADAEPAANVPKYKRMSLVARWLGLRLVVGPVMKIMFGPAFLKDPARAPLRAEMKRQLLANDRRGSTLATMGIVTRAPVEGELDRISVPTLVVSGEADSAIVPERSQRTAARIKGAKFVSIPRAGHSSSVEEPEAVNRAIDEFLKQLD